ncbi:MAG: hypothetical protein HUU28_09830 [Planctomycetaceae bacterium]|nr:hypothetical protein [Planctomycetaceae bacterium]
MDSTVEATKPSGARRRHANAAANGENNGVKSAENGTHVTHVANRPKAVAREADARARRLLAALTAFANGDFGARLPAHWSGIDRSIADAFNQAIARAQLEELERIAEQHQLAGWQPDLCAELYGALYSCHRALNQGYEVAPEARLKEQSAFERLCQLDAAAALRISMGG